MLAFLPKFRHALLDLGTFDPDTEEEDLVPRVVLQLMKLARTREMLRYFRSMAALAAEHLQHLPELGIPSLFRTSQDLRNASSGFWEGRSVKI